MGASGGLQKPRAHRGPRLDNHGRSLPRLLTSKGSEEKTPCCPWPWDPPSSHRGVGNKRDHSHPPFTSWLLPASPAAQCGPHRDSGSVWTPARPPVQLVKRLPRRRSRLQFKPQPRHSFAVGHPRSCHWKLPTFSLVSLRVQGGCDRDGAKELLPLLSKTGTRVPPWSPSCYMALGKSQPLSDPHPWTKRIGWAGSEVKPGYGHSCTCTHTQTHTHHLHSPPPITHIIQRQTHTYHRPLGDRHHTSFITALPPLHKLPVPSSVPRNHLPNIRILKNMARF